jgi:methanogenic corrinoid protein MtbC1
MTDILETIKKTVVGGKFNDIEKQVQQAVDSGTDLKRIVNDALIGAMDIVGQDSTRAAGGTYSSNLDFACCYIVLENLKIRDNPQKYLIIYEIMP